MGVGGSDPDGDVGKSIETAREVRVYALSAEDEPSTFDFINVTDRVVPLPLLEWAGTLEFWGQLHADRFGNSHQYDQGPTTPRLAML